MAAYLGFSAACSTFHLPEWTRGTCRPSVRGYPRFDKSFPTHHEVYHRMGDLVKHDKPKEVEEALEKKRKKENQSFFRSSNWLEGRL